MLSMVPALSWIDLLRSGTLFWKASSCCENSSTGDAPTPLFSACATVEATRTSAKKTTAADQAHAPPMVFRETFVMACLPRHGCPNRVDFG
jgi:hypothetical protein